MKNILIDDKYILLIIPIIVISLILVLDMSILSAGGIILIMGAYYTYYGNIYFSILSYTIADICWAINAVQHNDIFGSLSIIIGVMVGIIVTYKMKTGIFNKSIKKETECTRSGYDLYSCSCDDCINLDIKRDTNKGNL